VSSTGATDPVLVMIGDVQASRHWIVTPAGTIPIRGAEVAAVSQTAVTQRIPVWAIVLAVVFFPLGLLFLLIKEDVFVGGLSVTVTAPGFRHSTTVATPNPVAATDAGNRVDYLRNLIANAPASA
jgi:hypothetical protein